MTKLTFVYPPILEKCLSKVTECPVQQQETCPLVILGSKLHGLGLLIESYEFLITPETIDALNSLTVSKDTYPKECFELISYLNGATINAIVEASRRHGNIKFPSDLMKSNTASIQELKQLWQVVKLVSNIVSGNDLKKQFINSFGGIFWQDAIPSSPSTAYTCCGTNHETREGDYLPIQIVWPEVDNNSNLILEFESNIPVGSCGKARISSQANTGVYYVLKLAPIEEGTEATALMYEVANSALPQQFASYIGIDIDSYPFIAISEKDGDDSWLDSDLETASLFNSACQLEILSGSKYSYQESARLAERMADSCNLPALQKILLRFSSYFSGLAQEESKKDTECSHNEASKNLQLADKEKQDDADDEVGLPLTSPSSETCELAAKGNIKALYELALYARTFDTTCSVELCMRAKEIYTSLFEYDKNSVNAVQQDDIYLLFLLTNPSIPLKDLRRELQILAKHPYEPIAENARKGIEEITPKRSFIERLKYWWKRPWGSWHTLPMPNTAKLDPLLDESIPVLELIDVRPWRGKYYICVSLNVDNRTGLLTRCGTHFSTSLKEVELNETEREYIQSQVRIQNSTIGSLSNDILLYAQCHTNTWQPYAQGWKILEQTKELASAPDALIKANPSLGPVLQEQIH